MQLSHLPRNLGIKILVQT